MLKADNPRNTKAAAGFASTSTHTEGKHGRIWSEEVGSCGSHLLSVFVSSSWSKQLLWSIPAIFPVHCFSSVLTILRVNIASYVSEQRCLSAPSARHHCTFFLVSFSSSCPSSRTPIPSRKQILVNAPTYTVDR